MVAAFNIVSLIYEFIFIVKSMVKRLFLASIMLQTVLTPDQMP